MEQLERCHLGPDLAPLPCCLIWCWLHPHTPQGGPKGRSEISLAGKTVAAAPKFTSSYHTIQSERSGLFSQNSSKREKANFSQKPQQVSSGLLALIGLVPISKPIQVIWGTQVAVPVVLSSPKALERGAGSIPSKSYFLWKFEVLFPEGGIDDAGYQITNMSAL